MVRQVAQAGLLLGALLVGGVFSSAEAARLPSAVPISSVPVIGDPAVAGHHGPMMAAPLSACCGERCIRYQEHRPLLKKKGCCVSGPVVQTVLLVKDPTACGCVVEVPVCIPACCLAESPAIGSRCGILGRGVVTYQWCCGFKLRMVVDRCGDITVHSYGR